MYTISSITNNTKCAVVTFFVTDELLNTLKTCESWSPGVYKDNYRLKSNFLHQPSLFVIDIDDGISIIQASQTLKERGLSFIIGTTRNHQKLKNDKICDRFRVLLTLNRPIVSEDEYNATFDWCRSNLFPTMDPTCREVGRQYFPCRDIVANEFGSAINVQAGDNKKEDKKQSKPIITGPKSLSKKSMEYLLHGIAAGSRDQIVFRIASDAKKNGYDEDEILELLLKAPIEYSSDFTENHVEEKVRSVYTRDTNFHEQQNVQHTQFLSNCFLAVDSSGERPDVAINRDTLVMKQYSPAVIKMLIGAQAHKELERRVVDYRFRPDKKLMFVEDADGPLLNTYVPPGWLKNHFYFGKELKVNTEIPQIVEQFLMHLVQEDKESYEYVLDWMAQMVQGRNLTILTLIGNEGIGKGTLGDLLRDIVGQQNWVKVRADAFKGRFNSQMENKLLVHIDEAHLSTTDEYNRLKDVVNPWIEVEQKGKDARMSRNYASYILASNDSTAINPSPDDRRFSIVNLTDKKIIETPVREVITSLYKPENIEALSLYLMQRKINHDMMRPFKSSKKSNEIVYANMPDWEKFLLQDYLEDHVGQKRSLSEVKEDIALECNMRNPPGRSKLEKFCLKYKEYACLVQQNRVRYMKIIACPKRTDVVHYEQL